MAMAQEEHAQKYSNSNSGGGGHGSRSSKKMKPKKVPQRGLGVAQLEKIRLEEQHRKDAALLAASVLPPTFRPHLSSSSSMALPPPSPTDLAPPNSAFIRPLQSPCVSKIDAFQPYSNVSFSKPLNVGGVDRSWPSMIVPGNHNWPKLSNGEYNLKVENQRFDHHGVGFQPNLNLPVESQTPVLPLPCVLQRSQQCQRPSSSSMVNVSTGISSSSALNYQMEPPSNQNYCGNNYTPLWPEEVKQMVGIKRPYPFSPEYPPLPAFRCKFPPGYMPSVSKTNESASSSTGCTFNVEHSNLPTREGPSNSDSMSESNPRRLTRENEGFGGDFLTLAPPAAASSLHLDPRYHRAFGNSAHLHLETSNQGGSEELVQRSGLNRSDQPLVYTFFPSANLHTGHKATPKSSYKGEASGGVDLNLKL